MTYDHKVEGLGAAKRRFLEAVNLDPTMSRLATKIAALFTKKYIRASGGGIAFPSALMICEDLGLAPTSERHVRRDLRDLCDREHLVCENDDGKVNHYTIHSRHFRDSDNELKDSKTDFQPRAKIAQTPRAKSAQEPRAKIAPRIHG